MRQPTGLLTVALLTPPLLLLLPLSLVAIAIERVSQSLFLVHTFRNWRSGGDRYITFYGPPPNSTSTLPSDYEYMDIDVLVRNAPTLAVIGVAVATFIVSVLGICGIWELRRVEGTAGHQRRWAWTVLVSCFAIFGASLGVLGWTSALQGKEGWKGYQDVGREGQRYTRETWVCQIDEWYPRQDWAGTACAMSKATRFMLIPIAVSAVLVMVSMWVLIHYRGGVKWLFGGKGRYGGFDSVFEMHPQKPFHYPPQPATQTTQAVA